jgi:hypothetical protein
MIMIKEKNFTLKSIVGLKLHVHSSMQSCVSGRADPPRPSLWASGNVIPDPK